MHRFLTQFIPRIYLMDIFGNYVHQSPHINSYARTHMPLIGWEIIQHITMEMKILIWPFLSFRVHQFIRLYSGYKIHAKRLIAKIKVASHATFCLSAIGFKFKAFIRIFKQYHAAYQAIFVFQRLKMLFWTNSCLHCSQLGLGRQNELGHANLVGKLKNGRCTSVGIIM